MVDLDLKRARENSTLGYRRSTGTLAALQKNQMRSNRENIAVLRISADNIR